MLQTGELIPVTRADRVRAVLTDLGFTSRDRLTGGTFIGPFQYMSPVHVQQEPWIRTYDPTTGDELYKVEPTSAPDYNAVIEAVKTAFESWREWPAPKRGEVIRKLGNALRLKKELLARLITIEVGKILPEALGEVQEAIDICDYAVGLSRQPFGKVFLSERPQHRMLEQWHPIGPVGVITAFNFPIAVWAWNAAIAAVCGNTVVWKGSELTPLVSIAVQKICGEVLEQCKAPDVFNLVTGGAQLGWEMSNDQRLPLISFTGSCDAGNLVGRFVASRFGKCLLELGGNNAVIVHEDANLDLAVRAIVFGAIGTAGQRCTTTRRIVVHQSIAKHFEVKLFNAYEQVTVGDPLEADVLMGPLISPRAVLNMVRALQDAYGVKGVRTVWGGTPFRHGGFGPSYVSPTILRMPGQSDVVKRETFAPILYMMTYKTLAEAIAIQNDVPQGLSSAIFTESIKAAEQFLSARGSDCGIANVNIGTSGAEIGGAFGGEKQTGGGREAGSDSWKAYMRRQTCTTNWGDDLPLAQGIKFA